MPDTRTERLILTGTGATTDQISEIFVIPKAAKNFRLSVDVTVGASLDLQVTLQAWLETTDDWIDLVVGIPTSPITEVSTTPMLFGAPAADSDIQAANVPIVGTFRAVVVHGNATAATYTVHMKPI